MGSGEENKNYLKTAFKSDKMSQENSKTSEIMIKDEKENVDEKNNKTNTLKNVKRKIRKLTFRRKREEEMKPQIIADEKSDKVENSSDESIGKEKFTFKKIFRKSSFRKIISNLQQITNFTVSIFFSLGSNSIHSLIHSLRSERLTYYNRNRMTR